jgi:threonine dehydratase
MEDFPSKQEILEAYERIQPYVHRTPILTSAFVNRLTSADVFFKCENFQKTGSFKVRGAANTILQLKHPKKVCAHSSGNHAQGVAYVAQRLGLEAFIVMPNDTPEVKKKAVEYYQGRVIESGPSQQEQEAMSGRVAQEQKADFIHPHNDFRIIAGAATCAYELYQEHRDLDYLLVPVGGGGLSGGALLATQYFSPCTQVVGVQPFLAADARDALEKGQVQPQYPPKTIAEGVRTALGSVPFPILQKYLSSLVLVTEEEIIQATRILLERLKIVVEPSGAMALAALIKDHRFRGKRVGIVISGGNADMSPQIKYYQSRL